jgi:hypothetical protein
MVKGARDFPTDLLGDLRRRKIGPQDVLKLVPVTGREWMELQETGRSGKETSVRQCVERFGDLVPFGNAVVGEWQPQILADGRQIDVPIDIGERENMGSQDCP